LRLTIRSSIVNFKKETKKGTVGLNLPGEKLQSTSNVLTVYKPIGRPTELLPVVELPPREKLNNFEIVIPLQKPDIFLPESENTIQPTEPTGNLSKSPDKIPEQATAKEQPTSVLQTPVTGLYNLQKYSRESKPDDRIAKQIRAILALLEQKELEQEESQETVYAVSAKDKKVLQIPISKSYSTAVSDPIYRPE
jgi:hypothetical protein